MKEWLAPLSLLALCSVSSGGCTATMQARLYDLESAERLTATFKANGSGHGPIWIGPTLEAADCKGEYVTIASGSAAWGLIYNGTSPQTVTAAVADNEQHGKAVVTCKDATVIQCEFITAGRSGHGSCVDNRARRYTLMF